MSDKVRVLRIIEYVGDRKWVEDTLKRGSVAADGIKDIGNGNIIKSCLIDKFPEILEKEEAKIDTDCNHCDYVKYRGTSDSCCEKNGCIKE